MLVNMCKLKGTNFTSCTLDVLILQRVDTPTFNHKTNCIVRAAYMNTGESSAHIASWAENRRS